MMPLHVRRLMCVVAVLLGRGFQKGDAAGYSEHASVPLVEFGEFAALG